MKYDMFKTLKWRSIGPHRGGRVVAVTGDPIDKRTFYFGACAGGVWKSIDGGVYWRNVSDGFFGTSSIGAITVSDSDSDIIYAGTGEACIRSNVSHGDGIYRSTNAGKSWHNVGLKDTRHIARIRIHPQNPSYVYVAALGHAFGPNRQRGIFRSKNGGSTWEHILFKSEISGAIDLAMDPNNPLILYASIWQVIRTPWSLVSAGPESGLWRSTDGGDTWTDLTDMPGMPKGIKGRIGVAVSPAKSGRVWAIVEANEGGLFLSDNGGDSWNLTNNTSIVRQRPFYHHHIFAHPTKQNTMWTLPIQAWQSDDAGRTFTMMTTPHSDNHDLWIDPRDPDRMIQGNDGGACVSFDAGKTWSTIYNQPTGQFYHVTTDNNYPYRVYGTQQDNSAISTPSKSIKGAIPFQDSYSVGPSESGHIAVRPDNPEIVYSGAVGSAPGGGGALIRYNHATQESRIITVWPEMSYGLGAKDMRYRFQWTFPILLSPHNPNVLYVAGNKIFRSIDEGTNWEAISPDLTRNDDTKGEPGGGPISRDVSGAEVYCTIFSLAESPIESGVFWAGSDDGLIHVSTDNATSWSNVTPTGIPEWATISSIEISSHETDTVFITAWNYKLDDYSPYIYRTVNKGKTWQLITNGISNGDFVRVVREDPERSGLLYAGTETGIYVSFNAGGFWEPLQQNLPVTPIHDLQVKDSDLVVGTHGRSFWILDDISILHQLKPEAIDKSEYLFQPRNVIRPLNMVGKIASERVGPGKNYWVALGVGATFEEKIESDDTTTQVFLDAGHNPPEGVIVTYNLPKNQDSKITLTFLNSKGQEINQFSSDNKTSIQKVPKEKGMNKFIWDLRYPGPRTAPENKSECLISGPNPKGPMVTPGYYSVKLDLNDQVFTQPIEIRKHPGSEASENDLAEQLTMLINIRDKISEINCLINEVRSVRRRLREWVVKHQDSNNEDPNLQSVKTIIENLNIRESHLIATWTTSERGQMGTPLPKLAEAFETLIDVVQSADSTPTKSSQKVFEHLTDKLSTETKRTRKVIDEYKTKVPNDI